MDAIEAVRACEAAFREAQLASDVAALDRLLGDELEYIGPDGSFGAKADDLAAHRDGLVSFDRWDLIEERLRQVGDTVVAMTKAKVAGRFQHRPFEAVGWTRVWRRQDGRWVVAAAHCSNGA